jgi:hypothetical protein
MTSKSQSALAGLFGSSMLSQSERFEKVFLKHIPIMITDNDKILCLPNRDETSHIGILGMTSKGKGILGHTIIDYEYWMKDGLCMILNDFQRETLEWSLTNTNKAFLDNSKIINPTPIGLPIVYVYPSNKNVVIPIEEQLFPHIKMSMPMKAIIRGIAAFYDLGAGARYLTANIERFSKCISLEDIESTLTEILREAFPDEKKKGFEDMKFKIVMTFKNIFDEEISDTTHTDAPAFLNLEKTGLSYSNLTIQSIFTAGLIPSIQTGAISNQSWFCAYMSFIVDTIYEDMQFKDEYLKDKTLTVYIPEVDKLWKDRPGGELIKGSVSILGTNGRMARIRLVWDTQNYDLVPLSLRSNTRHVFAMRFSNSEEVAKIKKDFNVDKEVEKWILGLETKPEIGKFECVALTTDDFVLYNLRDGSVTNTSEPQRGRLITPLSHHRTPGKSLKKLIYGE